MFGQKIPFGPKKSFGSEKVNSVLRPAVLTLESILDGDKCCMRKWLCASCPKIIFL